MYQLNPGPSPSVNHSKLPDTPVMALDSAVVWSGKGELLFVVERTENTAFEEGAAAEPILTPANSKFAILPVVVLVIVGLM